MNNFNLKGISIVWLSKTDLSNLNAGEGGGGNVTELKTYDNGRKPYASGQSVRHAIRQAVERNYQGALKCTPESPCGNVKECWLCDMFGYLNPKLGEGFDRRWSPIKVTPALGQIASEIVTDMLIRMSDKTKSDGKSESKKEETLIPMDEETEEVDEVEEKGGSKDQRIAYVQIMSNVYRIGLSLDVANLGKVIKPVYEGKGKEQKFREWEIVTDIGNEERKNRAIALLHAIGGIADFAKQARNATSLAPDIFIAGMHTRYSHRILRALSLDDKGNVNPDELRVILQDLQDDGAKLFLGFTPQVVANEGVLISTIKEFNLEPVNPIRALQNLMDAVRNASIE
ncbi:TPA: type I-B CRISPR-associated protein Cas7/Cst2/DevR [bacterium]|nr:type I-B CRISPR-associated protein Cas7/Cst2/DevR [bacterium]